jgi:hypothetical protein
MSLKTKRQLFSQVHLIWPRDMLTHDECVKLKETATAFST